MAKFDFSDVQSPDSWGKLTSGTFTLNGASSPATTAGTGWTVARTGTGEHTVTLTSKVGQILAVIPVSENSAAADDSINSELSSVDHTNNTFTVTTVSGASGGARTATDLGTDTKVNFMLFYRSTAVQP